MSPQEWRASLGLAGIFALRMLGMFIILPVFALYAVGLPGGQDATLVGLALGAYGLTQAILQIPLGWLSDRVGRKPVIMGGLVVFALGSFIAASANSIEGVILGRIARTECGGHRVDCRPNPRTASHQGYGLDWYHHWYYV